MQITNHTRVRRLALDYAAKARSHKWERVSADFLARIDAACAAAVRREVDKAPSVGKTLQ